MAAINAFPSCGPTLFHAKHPQLQEEMAEEISRTADITPSLSHSPPASLRGRITRGDNPRRNYRSPDTMHTQSTRNMRNFK